MDLTVHLLTKNNETTIEKAINSLKPLNCHIVVADLGSTDNTVNICKNNDAEIVWTPPHTDHSYIRNNLVQESSSAWHMYLEPWEMLIQGHQEVKKIISQENAHFFHLSVIRNSLISKEIRLWRKLQKNNFINPVFERVNSEISEGIATVIYAGNDTNQNDLLERIEWWKSKYPTNSSPYYYQACLLLAAKKYDEFLKVSSHYMFLEQNNSMSAVMNRYYYATVMLCHKKQVKPALQNLNLCLCAKPLMAEFWCLTGDVHYHLLQNFDKALWFYKNAITLGKHRLQSDKWPIDISKYNSYPTKMIESCEGFLNSNDVYV